MSLWKLSAHDRRVIFECLTAAAKGPFFTEEDLLILFGVTRHELLGIVSQIPHLDDSERSVRSAIGHALNDLLRYPHGRKGSWNEWISVSPEAVAQTEQRWQELQPPIEYSSLEKYGPVGIGGKFYRVVSYTIRNGGHGMGSEVWKSGRWMSAGGGPGCNTILATRPASEAELNSAGVDGSRLPLSYDPLAAEEEESYEREH
jgi:hypothetical protein